MFSLTHSKVGRGGCGLTSTVGAQGLCLTPEGGGLDGDGVGMLFPHLPTPPPHPGERSGSLPEAVLWCLHLQKALEPLLGVVPGWISQPHQALGRWPR